VPKAIKSVSQKLPASWVIGQATVTELDQTVVKVKEKLFLAIDKEIPDEHGFFQASQKGMVSKNYGSIGVKIFTDSHSSLRVEVKINGGNRAWSDEMFQNDDGKTLAVIGSYGNHARADKAFQNKIKMTKVQSAPSKYLRDLMEDRQVHFDGDELVAHGMSDDIFGD
jgi:ribosomal protein L21E